MGQAILIKAGFGGGNGGSNNSGEDANITGWQVKTEIITTNGYFSVPKAKDQEFHVRIFGGGGGGSRGYNFVGVGGGGGNMNNDTFILNKLESIQVSIGAGGSACGNGGTTSFGTYLSATGGEAGNNWSCGGNGGSGGGGAMCYHKDYSDLQSVYFIVNGGSGSYGGGGGSDASLRYDKTSVTSETKYCYGGKGGTYGGNGNSNKVGTNTLGMVELDFVGEGKTYGYMCGSGGYGGDGGRNIYGGGGGYGAAGGNSASGSQEVSRDGYYYYTGFGGGGGYGGNGGDAYIQNLNAYGGYGGGYGPENYGRGGRGDNQSGKAGIVIITYQAPIYSN